MGPREKVGHSQLRRPANELRIEVIKEIGNLARLVAVLSVARGVKVFLRRRARVEIFWQKMRGLAVARASVREAKGDRHYNKNEESGQREAACVLYCCHDCVVGGST